MDNIVGGAEGVDSWYSPPSMADKMRIKGAASEPIVKAKVAAVNIEHDEPCAITASQSKNGKNCKHLVTLHLQISLYTIIKKRRSVN